MPDISHTLVAKSDQLNADDLTGRTIVVRIEDVRVTSDEQPVVVKLSHDFKPWKPCKTMRRLMAQLCGTDASNWVGRWVELYRDPDVKWAGKKVGGIRVRSLSGLDRPTTINLRETKKSYAQWTIRPLKPPTQDQPAPDLEAVLRDTGITRAQLDAHLPTMGRPVVADMTPQQLAGLCRWLANNADKIPALPTDGQE